MGKTGIVSCVLSPVHCPPTPGPASCRNMPSKPIPGSSGEVLTMLPSAYTPHPATGLLHLPRFLAKCKYVKEHGALPASYAKNFKRGCDRFLSLHLGINPDDVEKIVRESARDEEIDARLRQLLPADVRAAQWNRKYVHMGMTTAGREFIREALTAMGCGDRAEEIKSVPDLIEFDEGRIE
jgi:hypothetical protein